MENMEIIWKLWEHIDIIWKLWGKYGNYIYEINMETMDIVSL
jgi:hypothetical protein